MPLPGDPSQAPIQDPDPAGTDVPVPPITDPVPVSPSDTTRGAA
jgi:hypothetical protein